MSLHNPPRVTVTSRLADDYLWGEVLNGGGYDLLAKPLDQCKLNRSIQLGLGTFGSAVLAGPKQQAGKRRSERMFNEIAVNLEALIRDFVNYGEAKQEFERLRQKVGIAG
jgi:hypothetical protein